MCAGREHRYTLVIGIKGTDHKLALYAKGAADAVAKADGWVQTHYGDVPRTFTVHHSGYSTREQAIEHGAIFSD